MNLRLFKTPLLTWVKKWLLKIATPHEGHPFAAKRPDLLAEIPRLFSQKNHCTYAK